MLYVGAPAGLVRLLHNYGTDTLKEIVPFLQSHYTTAVTTTRTMKRRAMRYSISKHSPSDLPRPRCTCSQVT